MEFIPKPTFILSSMIANLQRERATSTVTVARANMEPLLSTLPPSWDHLVAQEWTGPQKS